MRRSPSSRTAASGPWCPEPCCGPGQMAEHLVQATAALGRRDQTLFMRDVPGVQLHQVTAEAELIDEGLAVHKCLSEHRTPPPERCEGSARWPNSTVGRSLAALGMRCGLASQLSRLR